jgi:glycosyltransferase involved in cell wall biosynthesis
MTAPPARRPLRVVHVLGNLDFGGLQILVLNLIGALPQFEHVVLIPTSRVGALQSQYAASCRVVVCERPPGSSIRYLARLTKCLRELAADVVIAHLFGNHTLVSWAARLAGVPRTYGVSANDPLFFSGSRWKPLVLAQLARPFCRGEVAVSEHVGRTLVSRLRLPAHRVRVIPNGCPVASIADRANRARDGSQPNAPPRILMVAAIGRGKDHPTAIRAIAELRSRGRRVELWFAGNPFRESRRTALLATIDELGLADLVRLLGGRPDVPELMATSDLVVHLSDSEGLPVAVIEAMAAGTPVIASDIAPCREVLDGGRCGLLVPTRDPTALADAIERLLDDPSLRRRLVTAAAERVRAEFDIPPMAARYAALITGDQSPAGR